MNKKKTTRRKSPVKKKTTRRKSPVKKKTTRRKSPMKKKTTRRKSPVENENVYQERFADTNFNTEHFTTRYSHINDIIDIRLKNTNKKRILEYLKKNCVIMGGKIYFHDSDIFNYDFDTLYSVFVNNFRGFGNPNTQNFINLFAQFSKYSKICNVTGGMEIFFPKDMDDKICDDNIKLECYDMKKGQIPINDCMKYVIDCEKDSSLIIMYLRLVGDTSSHANSLYFEYINDEDIWYVYRLDPNGIDFSNCSDRILEYYFSKEKSVKYKGHLFLNAVIDLSKKEQKKIIDIIHYSSINETGTCALIVFYVIILFILNYPHKTLLEITEYFLKKMMSRSRCENQLMQMLFMKFILEFTVKNNFKLYNQKSLPHWRLKKSFDEYVSIIQDTAMKKISGGLSY